MPSDDDLTLEPGSQYRRVHTGPLDNPRTLMFTAIALGALSIGGAWAATTLSAWWAPFLPIPTALGCGICIAGLFPQFWFGRDN